MKKYIFSLLIAFFLITGCASTPLKITILRIDVDKCDLMLAQQNPILAEGPSKSPTDIIPKGLLDFLDDDLKLLLLFLKPYPFVKLDFKGTIDFMDIKSDSTIGMTDLYLAIEKFIARSSKLQED